MTPTPHLSGSQQQCSCSSAASAGPRTSGWAGLGHDSGFGFGIQAEGATVTGTPRRVGIPLTASVHHLHYYHSCLSHRAKPQIYARGQHVPPAGKLQQGCGGSEEITPPARIITSWVFLSENDHAPALSMEKTSQPRSGERPHTRMVVSKHSSPLEAASSTPEERKPESGSSGGMCDSTPSPPVVPKSKDVILRNEQACRDRRRHGRAPAGWRQDNAGTKRNSD